MRFFSFSLTVLAVLALSNCGPAKGKKSDLRRASFAHQRAHSLAAAGAADTSATTDTAIENASANGAEPASGSESPQLDPATGVEGQSYSQFLLRQQMQWSQQLSLTAAAAPVASFSFQDLHCAEGVDCKDRIVAIESTAGRCAGVLLTNKIAMTNRHCVEDIASQAFGSLNAPISVSIPKRFATSERAEGEIYFSLVKRVIGIGPTQFHVDGMKADFVFLELQDEFASNAERKLNTSGIRNGETYFIYSTPAGASAGQDLFAVERRECTAVYNTTVGSFFDAPKDPIVIFSDCPIGPANSGSPIYNSNHELVGLIGGQLSPRVILPLQMIAVSLGIFPLEQNLTNVGWAVNLACIPNVQDLAAPVSAECDADFSRPLQSRELPADLQSRLSQDLRGLPTEDEKFRYMTAMANEAQSVSKFILQGAILLVPSCVKPEALQSLNDSFELEIKYSALRLSPTWTLLPQTTGQKVQRMNLRIDKAALQTDGTSSLEINLSENMGVYRSQISVCR